MTKTPRLKCLGLRVGNGCLHGLLKIKMEQGTIQSLQKNLWLSAQDVDLTILNRAVLVGRDLVIVARRLLWQW
jgi:hypothetical protein